MSKHERLKITPVVTEICTDSSWCMKDSRAMKKRENVTCKKQDGNVQKLLNNRVQTMTQGGSTFQWLL